MYIIVTTRAKFGRWSRECSGR